MNRPKTRREARERIEQAYQDAKYDRLDRSVFENSLGIVPGRSVSDRSDFELRKIIDAMVEHKLIATFE